MISNFEPWKSWKHQQLWGLRPKLLTKSSIFAKQNLIEFQKHSPRVFCKKGILRNFAKFTGKHLCQSLLTATLLKNRFLHRCFPVNFAKFLRIPFLKSCLYEEKLPMQVRHLTWVRSRQNGVYHFGKSNRLYENGFIPSRWDLTSTQVRSQLGRMIFFHVNSFCQAVPPRQDCSLSLDSVCFCNYYVKMCNSSLKLQCRCLSIIRNWNKKKNK